MDPYYPLKFWFATLLLGPILYFGLEWIREGSPMGSFIPFFLVFIVMGIIYGYFLLLTVYIAYLIGIRTNCPPTLMKIIISGISFVYIPLFLHWLYQDPFSNLYFSYSLAALPPAVFLKIKESTGA